ncbi:DUF3135 domain-containing protein [Thaumasiovibrio sp. DFM-14]|uniref:DUF3135 domain-containing protein n=1 Tax=Thaumasiovibrio sp. DFM-14 TaxID=3384792 RepID=UPI0039A3586B
MEKLPPFDELVELAKHHPDKLEALRERMVNSLISEAREEAQPRLRAQQYHIQQVIQRGKNPNHTNVLLLKELQAQLYRLSLSINDPTQLQQHTASIHQLKPRSE